MIDYYDLIPNYWLLWFDSKWLIIIIRFQMIEYYDLIPNTNINQSLTWYDGLREMDACPQPRHPEERDETYLLVWQTEGAWTHVPSLGIQKREMKPKIITHDYRRTIQLNTAERDTHTQNVVGTCQTGSSEQRLQRLALCLVSDKDYKWFSQTKTMMVRKLVTPA